LTIEQLRVESRQRIRQSRRMADLLDISGRTASGPQRWAGADAPKTLTKTV
jgi:hypothetical protein